MAVSVIVGIDNSFKMMSFEGSKDNRVVWPGAIETHVGEIFVRR